MTGRLGFALRRLSGLLVAVYLPFFVVQVVGTGDVFFVRGLWTRGPLFAVLELALLGALTLHALDALFALRVERRLDTAGYLAFAKWALIIAVVVAVTHIPIVFGLWVWGAS